ncbi:hypothetical protein BDZ97DRAFT_1914805 [Flammula alnicola]|nr:hypothetical protein BDZ97DRAFT_1928052 [Flammula alnicola]KAF8970095.1 hypothetical protein BDZ97DRAFT_1914805 [Flammula alnicola]
MKHAQTAPGTLGYVRLGTNTPLDRLWMSTATHEGSRATDNHSRTPQTPTNTRGTPGPPVDAYNPPINTNTGQHRRSIGSAGTRRGIQAVGGPPGMSRTMLLRNVNYVARAAYVTAISTACGCPSLPTKAREQPTTIVNTSNAHEHLRHSLHT